MPTADLRFDGDVAILELTNGTNEFNHKVMDDLNDALDKVLNNPDAGVLVTYSTGKHYSNGIALSEVFGEGIQRGMEFSKKLCEFIERLLTFPMPTVAAINGHAYAGGLIMTLAHDYRIMNSQRGWLCLPEINMPQLFPPTLLEVIKAKISPGNAHREMITMGKKVTGPEALNLAIIDSVSPPDKLLQDALELARNIIRNGNFNREAMIDMKRDVYKNVTGLPDHFKFMTHYIIKKSPI